MLLLASGSVGLGLGVTLALTALKAGSLVRLWRIGVPVPQLTSWRADPAVAAVLAGESDRRSTGRRPDRLDPWRSR